MTVSDSVLSTFPRVCITRQIPLFALAQARAFVAADIVLYMVVIRSPPESALRNSSDGIVCILLLNWLRLRSVSSMLFELDDP